MHKTTRAAIGAASLLAVFSVTACGSDHNTEPVKDSTPTAAHTSAPADTTPSASAPSDGASNPAASSDSKIPSWASGLTKPGSLLTTIKVGQVKVDVYQAGTATAPKDGMFVDPDTHKPILTKGDPLVFVNYVVTNTGDKPVSLSNLLVDITPTYDDWKWLQGMDGSTDRDLFKQANVFADGYDYAKAPDNDVYIFEPGQSFSYGDNFAYEKGQGIKFEARLVPSLPNGDLDHDHTVEAEAHTTIK